jgi:hypothetical protein
MTETTRPIITIHDVLTDEVVTREMNDTEYAQHQLDLAEDQAFMAAQAEAEAAAQAKKDAAAAVLAKLGITQDVLDLLTK